MKDVMDKELEKLSFTVNQYMKEANGEVDKLYKYFKDDRKDLAIVASTGAVIGAIGYTGMEAASKLGELITPHNTVNIAHHHLHGLAKGLVPIAKHVPAKIGHHAHVMAHQAGHHIPGVMHHVKHLPGAMHHLPGAAHHIVAPAASHAAVSASLTSLFTATVITASVALVCYELYKRNEKDMAKYMSSNLTNSPELQSYIEEVGKDSGAIDRLKKGEYIRLKDVKVMVELTGRYLGSKGEESLTHINNSAQEMIGSMSKYLSSVKAQSR